jgi:hypothetical protein
VKDKAKPGRRLRKGSGWKLVRNGKQFSGSLHATFNMGGRHWAIFLVRRKSAP